MPSARDLDTLPLFTMSLRATTPTAAVQIDSLPSTAMTFVPVGDHRPGATWSMHSLRRRMPCSLAQARISARAVQLAARLARLSRPIHLPPGELVRSLGVSQAP